MRDQKQSENVYNFTVKHSIYYVNTIERRFKKSYQRHVSAFFIKLSSCCDPRRFFIYNWKRLRKYEISFTWLL